MEVLPCPVSVDFSNHYGRGGKLFGVLICLKFSLTQFQMFLNKLIVLQKLVV